MRVCACERVFLDGLVLWKPEHAENVKHFHWAQNEHKTNRTRPMSKRHGAWVRVLCSCAMCAWQISLTDKKTKRKRRVFAVQFNIKVERAVWAAMPSAARFNSNSTDNNKRIISLCSRISFVFLLANSLVLFGIFRCFFSSLCIFYLPFSVYNIHSSCAHRRKPEFILLSHITRRAHSTAIRFALGGHRYRIQFAYNCRRICSRVLTSTINFESLNDFIFFVLLLLHRSLFLIQYSFSFFHQEPEYRKG